MESIHQPSSTLLPVTSDRKSNRAYSEPLIEKAILTSILKAAQWTPSSMNEQPWRYIVAEKENTKLYAAVFSTLAEANQLWAKNAPIVLVSLARKNYLKNGNPNRHALYEVGVAYGVNIHQMGGFHQELLINALNVLEDIEIAAVLFIGYPSVAEDLPEPYKTKELAPRWRFSLTELVMTKPF